MFSTQKQEIKEDNNIIKVLIKFFFTLCTPLMPKRGSIEDCYILIFLKEVSRYGSHVDPCFGSVQSACIALVVFFDKLVKLYTCMALFATSTANLTL